jgi:acetolactate synthase-1/3 small subunit
MEKLEDVIAIRRLDPESGVYRELALVKVRGHKRKKRADIVNIAKIFRARVLDVSQDKPEPGGDRRAFKNRRLVDLLKPYGIPELARTAFRPPAGSADPGV